MEIIADAKMTPSYVSSLERGKHLAFVATILMVLAGMIGLFFRIAQDTYPDLISNILYPLTSFVGASWAFITAFRTRWGRLRLVGRHQLAWLLVGIGLLANSMGGLYHTYIERTGQTYLVPSFSDVGFTLFYPLIFVGLFLMPTALRFRLRMALDALITTLCILGVAWFFIIRKVFVAQIEARVSIPELVTVVSYPFWDMLLILAILLMIYRRTQAHLLPSLFLFGAGILSNIWADTGYAYSVAIGTYSAINFLIDPFWYLGFLLVGLSGLYQYAAMARFASQGGIEAGHETRPATSEAASFTDTKSRNWQYTQNTLVYVPLAILLVLVFYSEMLEYIYKLPVSFSLVVVTVLVGILVALRSLIAIRENERLLKALAIAKEEQEANADELKGLYSDLRVAHDRLQELDKLKDQFMITASHELRTPLTSVQGYLELLVEYSNKTAPELQREFLMKAQRSSEELGLLLSNVMDVSRLEVDAGLRPANVQPVEVSGLLQSVIDILEPQLTHEQRKLELQIPETLTLQADPVRLRQVLLNLSVNAMKYSPVGTPITFSARSVSEPGPYVILSVMDKGKGIDSQDQERIFQRFVRLERDLNSEVRGSGLGLYISRRLVEAMGGEIWVESYGVAGEGSSFNIKLPMSR